MVGVIGIVLASVTIASHRAHTAAVIYRTEANDQWAFYEAKKIREHLVNVTAGLEQYVVDAGKEPDIAGFLSCALAGATIVAVRASALNATADKSAIRLDMEHLPMD